MVTLKELNPRNLPTTPEQEANLRQLFEAVNKFRALYGKPMVVTSGLRDIGRQTDIDVLAGRHPRLGSAHLKGAAADFHDPHGELKQFVRDNPAVLERCGLYMEGPEYTPTWIHLQSVPPKSGKRIYQPYSNPPPAAGSRK